MINNENTNNDKQITKVGKIRFRSIYVWASVFLFIVLVKMFIFISNMSDLNYRMLNYVIEKNNNLNFSDADIFEHYGTVYFDFENCYSNYQDIVDSFTEYMEKHPDIYHDDPPNTYLRFSHKINHNHSETFLEFSNLWDGKKHKTFEVGELYEYCANYLHLNNNIKITCIKILYFDTRDLGSKTEDILKVFDGIEEFHIKGSEDEKNTFIEIINKQFPGSKIFYNGLEERK